MKNSEAGWWSWPNRVGSLALLSALAFGCSTEKPIPPAERVAKSAEALSAVTIRTYGFESLSDWSPYASTPTLSLSTTHLEGLRSLSVAGGGWSSVISRTLVKEDPAPTVVGFDLRIPSPQPNPAWFGTVQLFISIPSQGINNLPLGLHDLITWTPGQFRRAEFNLPANVQAALNTNFNDLRWRIELNRPVNATAGYLFDRFTYGPLCTPQSDNNPCTTDTCNAQGQQVHTPVPTGTSCSDGNACNGAETCNATGTCIAGTPVTCTASDQCHNPGTCNPATGTCSNPSKPNGSACSDANACTQSDTCQSGSCTAGTPLTCTASDQCHNAGTCSPATGVCSNPAKPNGTACNDNSACTQADTCQTGTCTGANPVVCVASDQCHDPGTCNPANGTCSNPPKPNGTACNDTNACTQTDSCQAGACAGANPVVCAASDQCHDIGTCTPATGACSNPQKPNGTTCNDTNACTQTDSCQAGTCAGSNPVVCTASDQCHDSGTCDSATGVCSNPTKPDGSACSDNDACTQADSCQAGTCGGSNPVVCTASDQCHDSGTCDSATGVCSNPTKPDGTACADQTVCNGSETCSSGTCTTGTPPETDDGNPCTADACDPVTGVSHTPVSAGTSCSNDNACDGTEVCNATGTCITGTPPEFDDGNPCTADACDPSGGITHTPSPAGTNCGDDDLCNGNETCDGAGTCVAGTPPDVDDDNPCTADSCEPFQGPIHVPAPAGTSCANADACDGAETCDGAGSCVAGLPPTTDDGNPCTFDTCDPVGGISHTPVAAGTSCSNGNACDGLEFCDGAGACVAGTPPVLDDGNACTIDSCDATTGVGHEPAADGTSCTDTTVCNGDESCVGGTCTAGTPLELEDGNACTADTCDPVTGVSHEPIAGCDQAPSVVGGRFETRASIVGRVQDELGAPITEYTVSVFDAPPLEPRAEDPRSDVSTITASDGSFRTRLETFPEAPTPGAPLHRVLVFVEGESFVRMSREAYLRPGDLVDLGTLVVLRRDSNVTFIDSSGGLATDSQNRVELNIPPGAVIGTVPVRITPIVNREQFPNRLPDATATMYGVVLEPDGTEFMVPVTMRVANYRNVPTGIVIPHGVADETSGRWLHQGFAMWDGERFRTTITHFSNPDLNAAAVGELVIEEQRWADANKRGHVDCDVGSSVSVASGTLRQSISLPTYTRQGRGYGITLTYDSGLTSSRKPASSGAPIPPAQVLHPSSFSVLVSGSKFRSECVVGGAGNRGGCGTGIPCSGGTWPAPLAIRSSGMGTRRELDTTTADGTDSFGTGGYVDLPINDDGSAPAPSYGRFEQTVTLGYPYRVAQGACLGSGFAFGVQGGQDPVPTAVPTGPQFRSSDYRLVYHRRGAVSGNGWGIAELNELFVAPDRSQADLVSGDGNHEVFVVRPRSTVISSDGALLSGGLGMATDPQTGEIFVVAPQLNVFAQPEFLRIFRLGQAGGVELVFGNLPIPSTLAQGSGFDLRLAITYATSGRLFVVANATGLYTVSDSGAVEQIAPRTGSVGDVLERPSVAAHGQWVYYATGLDDVVLRANLDDATPVLEPITATDGDIALDTESPAGEFVLQGAQGLATDGDGSLYVACPDRNVVYQLEAEPDGSVGTTSVVRRVIGDGSSSTFPRIGSKHPALALGVRAPFEISVAPDGSVTVLSTAGVAAFDPGEQTIRWIMAGSAFQDRDFLHFDPAATGEAQPLSGTSFLVKFVDGLVRVDYGSLASEEDPTRTIVVSPTGAVLTDATADLVESYSFFDDFKGQARLTNRAGRSGEALLTVAYSAGTKVESLSDPSGGEFHFSYTGSGKLSRITDAAGRTTDLSVDSEGNLRSITLPTGDRWGFDYDATRMTQATNPRGGQSHYEYQDDGTLASSTKPEGATITLSAAINNQTYDETGKLSYVGTMTTARGVERTFSTNSLGQFVRIQEAPDGVPYDTRFVFTDFLRSELQSGARSNSLFRVDTVQLNGIPLLNAQRYDDTGRLQHVYGSTTSFDRFHYSYGADDRIRAFTHRLGSAQNFEYDTAGRLSREYDTVAGFGLPQPTGREALFTWRPDGQPSTITEHGVTSTLGYQQTTGLLSSVSDITGTQTFTYDAAGNVASVADGVTSTSYTYDSGNRLTEIRDALGHSTTLGYDDASCGCSSGDLVARLKTPDLPLDRQWSFSYDREGHLTGATDPLEQLATFSYAPTGELEAATDALGRTTSYSHDQQGRPSMLVDSSGRVSVMTYPTPLSGAWSGPTLVAASPNSVPAPTSLSAPLAPGQYQVGYNGYGSLDKPPVVELYRDATFELAFHRVLDPVMTNEVTAVRDRVGFPIDSLELPLGGRLFTNDIYQYDGRFLSPFLTFSAAPIGNVQASDTFFRNAHSEVTRAEGFTPLGEGFFVEADYNFGRDAAGRPTSWSVFATRPGTDEHGSGILLSSTVSGGVQYDPVTGYVSQHDSGFATRNISYDERGLVREALLSFNSNYGDFSIPGETIQEGTFRYEYDEIGRNTRLEFPDGHVRIQEWDVLGRLTSRCYNYTTPHPSRCYTATYDAVGNPQVLTDPEGRTEVDYDDLDRVTEVRRFESAVLIETETYVYNVIGGFTVYDGQPVDDQRPRLGGGGTAPAAVPSALNGATIQIDAVGRVTTIGPSTFSYDNRGRVRSFGTPAGGASFTYDALGRRGRKQTFEGPELVGWDGDNPAGTSIVETEGGSHKMNRAFVDDGIDHPLWMLDAELFSGGFDLPGASVYFELDTLGNVRRLRGGQKASDRSHLASDLGGYRYSAFGKLRPPTPSTPLPIISGQPFSQPFRWQGRWAEDNGATIYDFRSRFWSTELGAFLQPDGFQYLGRTGTLWSWPGQNPFRWRDPTGRFASPEPTTEAIFLAAWGLYSLGTIALDAVFDSAAANQTAQVEADVRAFDAASKERQERSRRERQAGAGQASCPPTPQAGGAGDQPPSGPPRNVADAPDDGPPEYRPNPAHDRGSSKFDPRKAPEPPNARDVYRTSQLGSDGKYYGRAPNGDIYRFSPDNAGGAHFSGGTGASGGPRPIPFHQIPRNIRQWLGVGRR